MFNKHLYYSLLKYQPNINDKNQFTIGLEIHIPEAAYSHLFVTTNYDQIKRADKSYNDIYMRSVLETLAYDLNCNYHNQNHSAFKNIYSSSFIKSKTNYLVNEFKFTEAKEILIADQNINSTISNLKHKFLNL